MVTLALPETLQPYAGQASVDLPITDLVDLYPELTKAYPKLADIIFEQPHQLSRFVNLYIANKPVPAHLTHCDVSEHTPLRITTALCGG